MTAPRNFREAFTEDPADVKDRARLVAERDSARDWAVALENRIARVEALAEQWKNATELGSSRPSIVMQAVAQALVAALTGGEEA